MFLKYVLPIPLDLRLGDVIIFLMKVQFRGKGVPVPSNAGAASLAPVLPSEGLRGASDGTYRIGVVLTGGTGRTTGADQSTHYASVTIPEFQGATHIQRLLVYLHSSCESCHEYETQ